MPHRIPFRHRTHEVSRLEAFSDIIFGFAMTLLVVSLEAPKTYHELMEMMNGVIPFAICFLLFMDIWYEHHHFFRRYAIHDGKVTALNTVLLFTVLFYVYPLKYVFVLFVNSMRGIPTAIAASQVRTLFTIYGLGFAAIFGIFGLLNQHAWSKRKELELNEVEEIDTKERIYDNFATAAFGLISAILANIVPPNLVGFSGFFYFFICIPKWIIPTVMGKRRMKAEDRMLAAAATT
jgi:uncharacterized membrane protein